MKEMELRSRMAVLIVAALLSVAGAFGTSAFLATQEAQAQPAYFCVKVGTTYYCSPYYH